jgi:hypothetical protein
MDQSEFLRSGGVIPPWNGETTAGRYLRELRALRQSNQDMLRQIEAETGHSFATPGGGIGSDYAASRPSAPPTGSYTLGPVYPGQSAETPGYAPQGPPEVAFAEGGAPNPAPTATPSTPFVSPRPSQIDPDAIMRGAQLAQAERQPWETTTQPTSNPYVDAIAGNLANFEPAVARPVSMGLLAGMGPPLPPPSPSWLSNPLQQRQPGMRRAQYGLT